ncbi:MAG: universal stress protein [Bacteroidales bacterium]
MQNHLAMKILAALDLSPASDKIISVLAGFAPRLQATVWLIHVAPPDPDFIGYDIGPKTERDFIAKKLHQLHLQIQEIARKHQSEGLNLIPLLVQGPTVETILEQAKKLEVDFIAVGSHGHTRMQHLLAGSVSKELLKKSDIPLLVVPSGRD